MNVATAANSAKPIAATAASRPLARGTSTLQAADAGEGLQDAGAEAGCGQHEKWHIKQIALVAVFAA